MSTSYSPSGDEISTSSTTLIFNACNASNVIPVRRAIIKEIRYWPSDEYNSDNSSFDADYGLSEFDKSTQSVNATKETIEKLNNDMQRLQYSINNISRRSCETSHDYDGGQMSRCNQEETPQSIIDQLQLEYKRMSSSLTQFEMMLNSEVMHNDSVSRIFTNSACMNQQSNSRNPASSIIYRVTHQPQNVLHGNRNQVEIRVGHTDAHQDNFVDSKSLVSVLQKLVNQLNNLDKIGCQLIDDCCQHESSLINDLERLQAELKLARKLILNMCRREEAHNQEIDILNARFHAYEIRLLQLEEERALHSDNSLRKLFDHIISVRLANRSVYYSDLDSHLLQHLSKQQQDLLASFIECENQFERLQGLVSSHEEAINKLKAELLDKTGENARTKSEINCLRASLVIAKVDSSEQFGEGYESSKLKSLNMNKDLDKKIMELSKLRSDLASERIRVEELNERCINAELMIIAQDAIQNVVLQSLQTLNDKVTRNSGTETSWDAIVELDMIKLERDKLREILVSTDHRIANLELTIGSKGKYFEEKETLTDAVFQNQGLLHELEGLITQHVEHQVEVIENMKSTIDEKDVLIKSQSVCVEELREQFIKSKNIMENMIENLNHKIGLFKTSNGQFDAVNKKKVEQVKKMEQCETVLLQFVPKLTDLLKSIADTNSANEVKLLVKQLLDEITVLKLQLTHSETRLDHLTSKLGADVSKEELARCKQLFIDNKYNENLCLEELIKKCLKEATGGKKLSLLVLSGCPDEESARASIEQRSSEVRRLSTSICSKASLMEQLQKKIEEIEENEENSESSSEKEEIQELKSLETNIITMQEELQEKQTRTRAMSIAYHNLFGSQDDDDDDDDDKPAMNPLLAFQQKMAAQEGNKHSSSSTSSSPMSGKSEKKCNNDDDNKKKKSGSDEYDSNKEDDEGKAKSLKSCKDELDIKDSRPSSFDDSATTPEFPDANDFEVGLDEPNFDLDLDLKPANEEENELSSVDFYDGAPTDVELKNEFQDFDFNNEVESAINMDDYVVGEVKLEKETTESFDFDNFEVGNDDVKNDIVDLGADEFGILNNAVKDVDDIGNINEEEKDEFEFEENFADKLGFIVDSEDVKPEFDFKEADEPAGMTDDFDFGVIDATEIKNDFDFRAANAVGVKDDFDFEANDAMDIKDDFDFGTVYQMEIKGGFDFRAENTPMDMNMDFNKKEYSVIRLTGISNLDKVTEIDHFNVETKLADDNYDFGDPIKAMMDDATSLTNVSIIGKSANESQIHSDDFIVKIDDEVPPVVTDVAADENLSDMFDFTSDVKEKSVFAVNDISKELSFSQGSVEEIKPVSDEVDMDFSSFFNEDQHKSEQTTTISPPKSILQDHGHKSVVHEDQDMRRKEFQNAIDKLHNEIKVKDIELNNLRVKLHEADSHIKEKNEQLENLRANSLRPITPDEVADLSLDGVDVRNKPSNSCKDMQCDLLNNSIKKLIIIANNIIKIDDELREEALKSDNMDSMHSKINNFIGNLIIEKGRDCEELKTSLINVGLKLLEMHTKAVNQIQATINETKIKGKERPTIDALLLEKDQLNKEIERQNVIITQLKIILARPDENASDSPKGSSRESIITTLTNSRKVSKEKESILDLENFDKIDDDRKQIVNMCRSLVLDHQAISCQLTDALNMKNHFQKQLKDVYNSLWKTCDTLGGVGQVVADMNNVLLAEIKKDEQVGKAVGHVDPALQGFPALGPCPTCGQTPPDKDFYAGGSFDQLMNSQCPVEFEFQSELSPNGNLIGHIKMQATKQDVDKFEPVNLNFNIQLNPEDLTKQKEKFVTLDQPLDEEITTDQLFGVEETNQVTKITPVENGNENVNNIGKNGSNDNSTQTDCVRMFSRLPCRKLFSNLENTNYAKASTVCNNNMLYRKVQRLYEDSVSDRMVLKPTQRHFSQPELRFINSCMEDVSLGSVLAYNKKMMHLSEDSNSENLKTLTRNNRSSKSRSSSISAVAMQTCESLTDGIEELPEDYVINTNQNNATLALLPMLANTPCHPLSSLICSQFDVTSTFSHGKSSAYSSVNYSGTCSNLTQPKHSDSHCLLNEIFIMIDRLVSDSDSSSDSTNETDDEEQDRSTVNSVVSAFEHKGCDP